MMIAFQVDPNAVLNLPDGCIEALGAIACFFLNTLWALNSRVSSYSNVTAEDPPVVPTSWFTKVTLDTQFVTSWVVVAFIFFELATLNGSFNLQSWVSDWESAVVLLAVLIGLLPGCGPQILITSLYIQGVIPLSAQLANAFSNDGDALFPAIALAPKAAIVASIYSAVPAIISGYAFHIFFER